QPLPGDATSCKLTLDQGTAVTVQFSAKPWTLVPGPVKNNLLGIWGAQPDNLFAAGETGKLDSRFLVLQWNGTAWSTVTGKLPLYFGSLNPLRSVHGSGDGDVWFAGASE